MRIASVEAHLSKEPNKSLIPLERLIKERASDPVSGAGACSDGLLEQIDRAVVLPEAGVDVGQVIRRDEGRLSHLLEVAQDAAGLCFVAGHRVQRTELGEPDGVAGRE